MAGFKVIRWGVAAIAASLAVVLAVPAPAQNFPERTIKLVVPVPPGGSTDALARLVTLRVQNILGQPVIIENQAGGGGLIAAQAVARANPDGYTLLIGAIGTLAILPSVKMPNFNASAAFTPVGTISTETMVLVVNPKVQAATLDGFLRYTKANPGKLNYGSAGIGTVSHVCGEYFAAAAGITLTHIPYKGTGPAMIDLLGGHIPVAFAPIPATHEHAKSGKLRMLAVTSAARSTLVPDIPTIAESGVPGFEAVLRYGLVAPAGTPRPIIERLNKELRAALATEEVRKRIILEGGEPESTTPEEHAAIIDREETKWSTVIHGAGITLGE
jgi:tripartite-type tricarboxylate transporter receptor subunit TctC